MDITTVILDQHAEQRRTFAMLDDVPRDDVAALGAIWERLTVLLEVHAQAEELFFYPRLLEVGTGAGGADDEADEVTDALGDHNDIRDGIARPAARAWAASPGGKPSWTPGSRTATTWPRRNARTSQTSAATQTWRRGTTSPCSSWPMRAHTPTGSPPGTAIRRRTWPEAAPRRPTPSS